MARSRTRRRLAARAALLLAAVAAVALIALGGTHALDLSRLAGDAAGLRARARAWGAPGVAAFVLADATILLALVVPAWFCTLCAGLLFGPWLGAAVALAGTTAGATAIYAVARAGFGSTAGLRSGQGGALPPRWAVAIRTHALSTVIALRLLPVVPFALVNIAAGVARVPASRFVLGTAAGILPSVLIYARLGDALLDRGAATGRLDGRGLAGVMLRPNVLLPLVALSVLAMLPALVGWLSRRRGRPAHTGRPHAGEY